VQTETLEAFFKSNGKKFSAELDPCHCMLQSSLLLRLKTQQQTTPQYTHQLDEQFLIE
jgi:hypothetical protein